MGSTSEKQALKWKHQVEGEEEEENKMEEEEIIEELTQDHLPIK